MSAISGILAFLLVMMWVALSPSQAAELNGRRFGMLPGRDCTPALKKAFAYARKHPGTTLILDKGRYEFHSSIDKDFILQAEGLVDFRLDGKGSLFLNRVEEMQDVLVGYFRFTHCANLRLENVVFDYPTAFLPWSQGRLLDVDRDGEIVTVRPHAGYRPPTPVMNAAKGQPLNSWITFHRPDSHEQIVGDVWRVRSVTDLGDGRYQLAMKGSLTSLDKGMQYVKVFRQKHGFVFDRCRGVTLERVTSHATSGFAFIFQGVRNAVLRRVQIVRKPGTDRIVSSASDGIHVTSATAGPLIEHCRLENLQDDAIVLSGRGSPVFETPAPNQILVSAHPTLYWEAGNEVDVVHFARNEKRVYKIGTVTPRKNRCLLTLDRALDLNPPSASTGDYVVFNRSFAADGAVVRHNVIRQNRARALKIHGRNMKIYNNTIESTQRAAVWFGSGLVKGSGVIHRFAEDIEFFNNHIRSALAYGGTVPNPAAVYFMLKVPAPGNRFFESISLHDNLVERSARQGFHIAYAERVVVKNNRILDCFGGENPLDAERVGIYVDSNCRAVEVSGNEVRGQNLETDIFWEK